MAQRPRSMDDSEFDREVRRISEALRTTVAAHAGRLTERYPHVAESVLMTCIAVALLQRGHRDLFAAVGPDRTADTIAQLWAGAAVEAAPQDLLRQCRREASEDSAPREPGDPEPSPLPQRLERAQSLAMALLARASSEIEGALLVPADRLTATEAETVVSSVLIGLGIRRLVDRHGPVYARHALADMLAARTGRS